MPVIENSTYIPPRLFKNPHISTIFPALFRQVGGISYLRERIETPDNDFVDLDWSTIGSDRLVLVLHGLEGSAQSAYVKGIVKAFNRKNIDAAALNFRSCSGEMNRNLYTYHSGATADLNTVIQHISMRNGYKSLILVGFSLGGNMILKYLGEQGKSTPAIIEQAIVFSVPCDLEGCSYRMAKRENKIYMMRFMMGLKQKIKRREKEYKEILDIKKLYKASSFLDFDEHFTAPVFGFKNAKDYWTKASSKSFIPNITTPTLLVNAKNDSFLTDSCFPYDLAKKNPNFYLETPDYGGHVGFVQFGGEGYWMEERAGREVKVSQI